MLLVVGYCCRVRCIGGRAVGFDLVRPGKTIEQSCMYWASYSVVAITIVV